jgi:hypothetical protein
MSETILKSERAAYLLAHPAELALFVKHAEESADDWLTINAECARLRAANAALVEALRKITSLSDTGFAGAIARAALSSAEAK